MRFSPTRYSLIFAYLLFCAVLHAARCNLKWSAPPAMHSSVNSEKQLNIAALQLGEFLLSPALQIDSVQDLMSSNQATCQALFCIMLRPSGFRSFFMSTSLVPIDVITNHGSAGLF